MKKVLLIITICVMTIFVNAQTVNFSFKSNGKFVNKSDNKDFVVIPFENKTSNELYNEVLKAVTKLYNSPKDVISKVDGEIISINGINANFTSLTDKVILGIKNTILFSMQYVLQFQFKDGKIKVSAPVITRLFTDDYSNISPLTGWLQAQKIFKGENPHSKNKYVIDDFNNTVNNLINSILLEISTEEDW